MRLLPTAQRGPGIVPALAAAAALLAPPGPADAATRELWIAAEPRPWTIVPNGRDALEHGRVEEHHTRPAPTVVYRRYTRGFGRRIGDRYGGIPGPLIRARVGDRIVIHFRNLDPDAPHSMHFHGVEYPFGSDGAWIPGFTGPGANVEPGETFTYRLRAGRDSAGVWPYHDHSPSMSESLAGGMYGALSIFERGERLPDREFVVAFSSMAGLQTIDGRAYVGNTPVFRARVGERVQWDVIALGDDHHTFHVHGHRWRDRGRGRDTQTIGPAESFRVRWREDAPGTWLYHCHVEDHMANGMIGIYRVRR